MTYGLVLGTTTTVFVSHLTLAVSLSLWRRKWRRHF